MEFCLVRIFLYSVRIQENTGQKKLSILIFFTQCQLSQATSSLSFAQPFNSKSYCRGLNPITTFAKRPIIYIYHSPKYVSKVSQKYSNCSKISEEQDQNNLYIVGSISSKYMEIWTAIGYKDENQENKGLFFF